MSLGLGDRLLTGEVRRLVFENAEKRLDGFFIPLASDLLVGKLMERIILCLAIERSQLAIGRRTAVAVLLLVSIAFLAALLF